MGGPRQLFFQCGPEMPKGGTLLHQCSWSGLKNEGPLNNHMDSHKSFSSTTRSHHSCFVHSCISATVKCSTSCSFVKEEQKISALFSPVQSSVTGNPSQSSPGTVLQPLQVTHIEISPKQKHAPLCHPQPVVVTSPVVLYFYTNHYFILGVV